MTFTRCGLGLTALICSSLIAFTVQAHECRLLGNATEGDAANYVNKYQICLGFLYEDAATRQPGRGKPNNLDFIPFLNLDAGRNRFLRVEETKNNPYPDVVDIKATVYWLNNKVFRVRERPPYNFNILGVGYSSPVGLNPRGNVRWKHTITQWRQGLSAGYPTYSDANDFVLPFKGMYMWVVEGTLRKGKHNPVYFLEKFTCQQPLWLDREADPSIFDCARY